MHLLAGNEKGLVDAIVKVLPKRIDIVTDIASVIR